MGNFPNWCKTIRFGRPQRTVRVGVGVVDGVLTVTDSFEGSGDWGGLALREVVGLLLADERNFPVYVLSGRQGVWRERGFHVCEGRGSVQGSSFSMARGFRNISINWTGFRLDSEASGDYTLMRERQGRQGFGGGHRTGGDSFS